MYSFPSIRTQALFLGGRVGPAVQKILVVDNLCLNKSPLKVGMDFSGGLRSWSPL